MSHQCFYLDTCGGFWIFKESSLVLFFMSRPYSTSSGSRGSYNFRPGARQRYAPRGQDSAEPDNTVYLQGLKDKPLQSISIPPDVLRAESLEITETRYLGSYNWTSRTTPTILVPGM